VLVTLSATLLSSPALSEDSAEKVLARLICAGKDFDPSGKDQGQAKILVLDQLSAASVSGADLFDEKEVRTFKDVKFAVNLFSGVDLGESSDWAELATQYFQNSDLAHTRISRDNGLGRLLLGQFSLASRGQPYINLSFYTSDLTTVILQLNDNVTTLGCQPPIFTPAKSH